MSSLTETKQMINENKDKLYELDYMRFIACLAVMIVHITATGVTGYIHGSFPYKAVLLLNRSLKFTTPIFIFLSGVTSFYSYRKKEFNYFSFLGRRLPKVLVAYIVWSIIYYAVYMKLGYYSWNPGFFVKSVLQGTMSYHLYFVIIITQMYVVGPLFFFILKKTDRKIPILVAAGIITMLSAEFIRFELSDRLFLKYMVFYMWGIYVTLERDKYLNWIQKNRLLLSVAYLASCIVYTVVSYYDMAVITYVWFVFSVASVFFVYCVGLEMKERLRKSYSFIKLFGQSSYYIYLMHPLVLTMSIMYAQNIGLLSVTKQLILYTVTVMPSTILSCLAFVAAKNKIRKSKKAAAAAV